MIGQGALEARGGADFAWPQPTRNLTSRSRRDARPMDAGVLWSDHRPAEWRSRDAAARADIQRAGKSASKTTDRASHAAPSQKTAPANTSAGRFEEMMQAAQDGDGAAYAQLLKEVTPLLRGAVRRRRSFLDAADIEDLVQETLLSVHAGRATYDPRRPFLPWLFAILERRIADLGRHHARRSAREVQDEDAALTTAADQDDTPIDDYGAGRLLAQAIRELPRRQRTAVELLKLREMSLKDASAASGMSSVALRVFMHRALISLRKKLSAAAISGEAAALKATP